MSDTFDSSDSLRSARPLAHARSVTFDGPIALRHGGELASVTVTYETYGKLNRAGDNAVLICHALSGDSHVARHDPDDDPGWWDVMVGPGKSIDTDHHFVICSNLLGGCRGTTGPNSIDPQTGHPYGAQFPVITVEDMVDVQRRLVDHLGIERLFAVVGGSLGGHQVLCWSTRYPDRMHAAVAIATSPCLTMQALAFDVVGRNAILQDPNFAGGQYHDRPDKPTVGLALARMLGHITYVSPKAMHEKFGADRLHPRDVATAFEKKFSVGSYLAHQGDKFVERFDPNSYVTLTMAMDLFDVGEGGALEAALAKSQCRWLVLSFTSDWLFPDSQSRAIVDALVASGKCVSYCNVASQAGHDTFLLEDDLDRYGEMVRAFLDTTTTTGSFMPPKPKPQTKPGDVLHDKRIDYERIATLIPPHAAVLDLGCASGELLARLAHDREPKRLLGVELDEYQILEAMRAGFDVIQADLNRGLPGFADNAFDYVVLSQTLQSIARTQDIVDEILRVGERCIISFANFAYYRVRQAIAEHGRSPVSTGGILHYEWHNTPNRRFLSVLDWQEFCAQRDIRIHRELFLDTERGREVTDDPNRNADLAIFVISR
jgi:homoserine O-acetyltransferase